jgi:hypothetical protein
MRAALRNRLVVLAACLAGAACEPPPRAEPVGAAIVDLPEMQAPLPPKVAATVEQLREIGAKGTYRDMAKLADATPGFRSNHAGMSHKDYWYLKMRTGDWPMAQVEKLLSFPYAVRNSERGKVYIWPRVATLGPQQITAPAARDIDRLLGEGQAEAIRNGEIWPGYVLGIAEDGTWLYFVSGAG